MDFWTSAEAPWWLSLVTLLIGLFGAFFTSKFGDERRFRAEERRLEATRAADRAKYLENRLLDELGLLISGAEAFRIYLASKMTEFARRADGKVYHDGGKNDRILQDLMSGSGSVIEPFRTQVARVLMVSDGAVRHSVVDLEERGRSLALAINESKDDFELAHDALRHAISRVIDAARGRIALAADGVAVHDAPGSFGAGMHSS